MRVVYIVFAAILAASPLASALAQGTTGRDVKAGDATESKAIKNGSATNSNRAGATGSTVVPGDKSSVAGDQKATAEQKTGQTTAGGK